MLDEELEFLDRLPYPISPYHYYMYRLTSNYCQPPGRRLAQREHRLQDEL